VFQQRRVKRQAFESQPDIIRCETRKYDFLQGDGETNEGMSMNSIYNGRTINMKWLAIGILALTAVFVVETKLYAHAEITAADTESVLVYPSIAVTVNKSLVLRLPKKASRVSVTQPQIAEAVVVAPDQILINGKAVGTTSLVVWIEENKTRKK
jgi:Flp pilus assembly secretin CpaC